MFAKAKLYLSCAHSIFITYFRNFQNITYILTMYIFRDMSSFSFYKICMTDNLYLFGFSHLYAQLCGECS